MRIAAQYSHLNGLEFLLVHKAPLWKEIQGAITSVDALACKTKKSKEKGMKGKMLFSPAAMNDAMEVDFSRRGWSSMRTDYWVTEDADLIRKTMQMPPKQQKEEIEAKGFEPFRSYNQTDFVKERIAVEVQFGKYSFVAYDLHVKHMAFFVNNTIDVGVEVLPMKSLTTEMSSGVPYYEGALYDLIREGRGVPPVPLILLGVVP